MSHDLSDSLVHIDCCMIWFTRAQEGWFQALGYAFCKLIGAFEFLRVIPCTLCDQKCPPDHKLSLGHVDYFN